MFKIGDRVKVKENLTDNSVAYCQRGQIGTITKYEPNRTFPYYIDLSNGLNDRMNWFWDNHLEILPPNNHRRR